MYLYTHGPVPRLRLEDQKKKDAQNKTRKTRGKPGEAETGEFRRASHRAMYTVQSRQCHAPGSLCSSRVRWGQPALLWLSGSSGSVRSRQGYSAKQMFHHGVRTLYPVSSAGESLAKTPSAAVSNVCCFFSRHRMDLSGRRT